MNISGNYEIPTELSDAVGLLDKFGNISQRMQSMKRYMEDTYQFAVEKNIAFEKINILSRILDNLNTSICFLAKEEERILKEIPHRVKTHYGHKINYN